MLTALGLLTAYVDSGVLGALAELTGFKLLNGLDVCTPSTGLVMRSALIEGAAWLAGSPFAMLTKLMTPGMGAGVGVGVAGTVWLTCATGLTLAATIEAASALEGRWVGVRSMGGICILCQSSDQVWGFPPCS